jgi:hypothetical protein
VRGDPLDLASLRVAGGPRQQPLLPHRPILVANGQRQRLPLAYSARALLEHPSASSLHVL